MNGLISSFVNVYAYLLKLYPPGYKSDFGLEREEVLFQALEDANTLGNRALFYLVIRELRDFPISAIRANVRELEVMMKAIETRIGKERFSWIGLLLGIWPFLFLGPVMAVVPYLPLNGSKNFNFYSPLWLAVVAFSMLIGIYVGLKKGFPRWVYPYLVPLFFAIVIPLLDWLSPILPKKHSPWVDIAFILIGILGIGALAIFLLNRFHLTRKIYDDIRNDWTRLSFGMLVLLAFYAGIYMGDHLPPFSVAILVPSVVVLLGAVMYLFSPRQLWRSITLIATYGVVLLMEVLVPNEEGWSIWASLTMLLIFLSPMLIGLFRRPQESQTN